MQGNTALNTGALSTASTIHGVGWFDTGPIIIRYAAVLILGKSCPHWDGSSLCNGNERLAIHSTRPTETTTTSAMRRMMYVMSWDFK